MSKIKNRNKFRAALLEWFGEKKRDMPWRNVDDPYLIWVSEVMLQQTQVTTVIPYYERFVAAFPTLRHLAEAPEDLLLKHWEGLGYYARARNLHAAAKTVVAQYDGVVPNGVETFRTLKGVGDYIAAAVQSIAFGAAVPVVDGNVKRVIARLEQVPHPVNHPAAVAAFTPFVAALLDRSRPGTFNQAMMELGALVCTPRKPRCDACPVAVHCLAKRHGNVDAFPKRQTTTKTPTYRVAAGVVWKGDNVLVTKRKPSGLLGGLWEFPGGKIRPEESAREACRREIREETGIDVAVEHRITEVRHAYTHFKIVMDVFTCRHLDGEVTLNGPVDFKWVPLCDLAALPFPGANNKFIPLIAPPPPAADS